MGKKGRGKGKTHALGQRGADNFVSACLGVLEAVVGDTDPWWGWEKGNFRKILVGGTQYCNFSVNLGFSWYFMQIFPNITV